MVKVFRLKPATIGEDTLQKDLFKNIRSGTKLNGKQENLSEPLSRITPASIYSQLHRTSIPPKTKTTDRSTRMIHTSQFGYICTAETPEGQNCGVLKILQHYVGFLSLEILILSKI